MTHRLTETGLRLKAGLNGDANQRAATQLLIEAVHGVWLEKLVGWPEYLRPLGDSRSPGGLFLDWHQLRDDVAADDHAWKVFNDWAKSYAGRHASEDEYENRLAVMVPPRPWHGASSSELVLLRIALELAPGGLLGDGIGTLDEDNSRTVSAALLWLLDR